MRKYLAIFPTIVCVAGCVSKKPDTTPRKPDSVSQFAIEQCVPDLKARILNGWMRFTDVADPAIEKEIRADSQSLTGQALFSVTSTEEDAANIKLSVDYVDPAAGHGRIRTFEIGSSEETDVAVTVTIISTLRKKIDGAIVRSDLTQVINFNSRCEPAVFSTDLATQTYRGRGMVEVDRTAYLENYGERVETKTTSITAPENVYVETRLLQALTPDEILKTSEIARGREIVFYGSSDLGWVKLDLKPYEFVDRVKERNEVLHGVRGEIRHGKDLLGAIFKVRSANGRGVVSGAFGRVTRYEDPATWELENLWPSDNYGVITVALSPGTSLQKDSLRLLFSTTAKYSFPNLAAYFDGSGVEPLAPFKTTLSLQSKPPIDYRAAAMPAAPGTLGRYLSASIYQDISSSEVQDQLKILRSKLTPGMDRAAIVGEIVRFLPSILKYDPHMTADGDNKLNIKSSEIIRRGKAVCEHFANLFNTFARALGVPSRAILGLNLYGHASAGAHVWNEFELRPGVWAPLDPQVTELKFNPALYIPLAIEHYEANPFHAPVPSHFLSADRFAISLLP